MKWRTLVYKGTGYVEHSSWMEKNSKERSLQFKK